MKKDLLDQYCGHLSTSQISDGMNASAANAARLADDASFLFEAGRFPTAASLAILSLEESGKVSILRGLATALGDKEVAEVWRRYRRQTEKNYLALMPDLVAKGARNLHEFRTCFVDESLPERVTYDMVKQLGFYTDCCGKAHWSVPTEVIDKELAGHLVSLAAALSKEKTAMSVRELDLWVTHMQSGLTKENLLKCAAAMVSAGLKPADYLDKMGHFTEGL